MKASVAQVAVIIVNYNTRAFLRTCVRSLRASEQRRSMDLIVVDNGSTDGSAEMVRREFPDVALCNAGKNLGFASASNLAAKRADAPWLLFLNPDTEVRPGAVDALIDFAEAHPGPGIYGGRTVFADGSTNVASCWNAPTPWSVTSRALGLASLFRRSEFFNVEEIGDWRRDSVREVDYIVGCFLLIERALWDRLGGFDTQYWLYGEDCDLCLRATALTGRRPLVTPAAEIVHHIGGASADAGERKIQILRSRATLIRRHWSRNQQVWGLAMETLWVLTRVLASAARARLGGSEAQAQARRWAQIWAARRDWRRGWPELADQPRKRLDKRERTLRFVASVLDPRPWAHLFRMVNYWNYAHVRPRRLVSAGRNVNFAPTVNLANAERISFGDDVLVGPGTMLWAGNQTAKIAIGSDVLFGPNVVVTCADYGRAPDRPMRVQAMREADILIGSDVWIGANAVIVGGVTISDGVIVGAGAVVTGDIPPMAIAGGVPARVVGTRLKGPGSAQ